MSGYAHAYACWLFCIWWSMPNVQENWDRKSIAAALFVRRNGEPPQE